MGLEQDVSYFLQVIDPYNNKQMTFSEIVHLFSAVEISLTTSTWCLRMSLTLKLPCSKSSPDKKCDIK